MAVTPTSRPKGRSIRSLRTVWGFALHYPGHIAVAALALLVALWLVLPNDAGAVPAFSRQTGMNCNSCHIGTYPTPLS